MATYDGYLTQDLIFRSFGFEAVPHGFGGFTYAGTSDSDTIYGSTEETRARIAIDPGTGNPLTMYDTSYGNDTLSGGAGGDYIDGRTGADRLSGEDGNDTILGGTHNDFISGGNDNDVINGNSHIDELHGGSGSDTIYGGQQEDYLLGEDGNDFISGDLQNDVMAGGSGADIFFISSGSIGSDIVQDFSISDGDRVQVASGVSYSAYQSGADTIVDVGGGNHLTLANVTLTSLPAGWIFS